MAKSKRAGGITKRNNRANKNHTDLTQRQQAARRRAKVADLWHSGKTEQEIADRLKVAQGTISKDLKLLRDLWHERASGKIEARREQEYAYAIEQRADAQKQWVKTHNFRYGGLMVAWSKRMAELMSLDLPSKSELSGPDGGPIPVVDMETVRKKRWGAAGAAVAAATAQTEKGSASA